MKDLSGLCGLPVKLEEITCTLEFEPSVVVKSANIRTLEEMRSVLREPSVSGPGLLYYMYRQVYLAEDRRSIISSLRYDLTVFKPGRLGTEYMKTFGHYHPFVKGTTLSYPELYEVIWGKALFVLQKPRMSAGKMQYDEIDKFVLAEVTTGGKIIIPPNYGHFIVNIGEEPIVTSDIVDGTFSSDYGPIETLGGAAYFVLAKLDGKWELSKNVRYTAVPKEHLVKVKPDGLHNLGIDPTQPLYHALKNPKANLAFLSCPQYFSDSLELEALFELEET